MEMLSYTLADERYGPGHVCVIRNFETQLINLFASQVNCGLERRWKARQ